MLPPVHRNLLYPTSVQKSKDRGSRYLWNVSQFIPGYAVPYSVRLYSWRGFFVVCVGHWTLVWDGQTNQIQIIKFISLRSIVIRHVPCTHWLHKRVSYLEGYGLNFYPFLLCSSHVIILYLVILVIEAYGRNHDALHCLLCSVLCFCLPLWFKYSS